MAAVGTRRARLTLLEKALDESSWSERQQAVRALLATPLISAADSRYASIRKNEDWLRAWFTHHTDWPLAVTAEAARLKKIPANPDDSTRPCRTPKTNTVLTRRGYVYLCLTMAALVRADSQVTLCRLAEQLSSQLQLDPGFAAAGIRSEMATQEERRELVGAIRLLLHWGVLNRIHDDEERFVRDASADALYNVNRPVLSRILATATPPSLIDAQDFEIRLASTHESMRIDSEETRLRQWRIRFFRTLLDDPVLYYNSLTDEERQYLDRQRASILNAIEQATGLVAEVRAEGIAMVDPTGDLTDYGLPEEGTDGHLTLLTAEWLVAGVRVNPDATIGKEEVIGFTRSCINEHKKHWRKGVSEPGQDRVLTGMVLKRLEALSLIRIESERIRPMAALGRYALSREMDAPDKETEPNLF